MRQFGFNAAVAWLAIWVVVPVVSEAQQAREAWASGTEDTATSISRLLEELKERANLRSLENHVSPGYRVSSDIEFYSAVPRDDTPPTDAGEITSKPEPHLKDTKRYFEAEGIEPRRNEIKKIIWNSAKAIENRENFVVSIDSNGLQMTRDQKRRFDAFVTGIQLSNVSLRSQALAITLMVDLNESLIRNIRSETDGRKRRELYATQAIFVYELADIIVEMLEGLENAGARSILALYQAEMNQIAAIVKRIERRSQAAQGNDSLAKGWLSALEETRTSWVSVLAIVQDQDRWVAQARTNRKHLEKTRDDASIQLAVLERTAILGEVIDSLAALGDLFKVREIPLLKVDAKVVLELLNLDPMTDLGIREPVESEAPRAVPSRRGDVSRPTGR